MFRLHGSSERLLVEFALAVQHGFLPGGVNTRRPDPAIPIQYLTANHASAPQRVLSNSFGFGGTNCSIVLGRAG